MPCRRSGALVGAALTILLPQEAMAGTLVGLGFESESPEVYDIVTIARGMRGGRGATWSGGSAPPDQLLGDGMLTQAFREISG